MGVNYDLHFAPCRYCGKSDPTLHIGKSSIGWTFTFRAHDDIASELDWRKKIAKAIDDGGWIENEHGDVETPEAFWARVEQKRTQPNSHALLHPSPGVYLDSLGNSFIAHEFS